MLFALKKIISGLMEPSSLIFFSLLAGALLMLSGRRRPAPSLLFAGIFISLLSFFPPVPDALLRRLEDRYAPYSRDTGPAPEWILVLGRSFKPGELPVTSRVSGEMYARLMETVRVSKELPASRMIVPLYGDAPPDVKQEWLISFCRLTGLPSAQTVVLPDAPDTEAEIRQALQQIGESPFVLITTASHMLRAMQIAQALGGRPVPAPCDFEGRGPRPAYKYLIPSSQNLRRTEEALHEYLGILWFRLTHTEHP
jgi:uncharacterized SAM-binding protein YcdF (DUF218 family)